MKNNTKYNQTLTKKFIDHKYGQRNGNQCQRKRDDNVRIYRPKVNSVHSKLLSVLYDTNKHNVPKRMSLVKFSKDATSFNPEKFGTINMAAYHAAARFMESPDNARPAAFLSFAVGRTRIPRTLAKDTPSVNTTREKYYVEVRGPVSHINLQASTLAAWIKETEELCRFCRMREYRYHEYKAILANEHECTNGIANARI